MRDTCLGRKRVGAAVQDVLPRFTDQPSELYYIEAVLAHARTFAKHPCRQQNISCGASHSL